jgi:hypothetical protein
MVGTEASALNKQTRVTRIKTPEQELNSMRKLEQDLHGMCGLAVSNQSLNQGVGRYDFPFRLLENTRGLFLPTR